MKHPRDTTPEELSDPEWEKAGRVHDWRNHVPEAIRAVWEAFTPTQRLLLRDWAEELAQGEEWE